MKQIIIRKNGHAGRITLDRPKAHNALTHDMVLAIEQALDQWRDDTSIKLLIIDASGDRAFCAGGDITDLHRTGTAGDYEYGRRFWRDEYRMNAKLARFPKPVVTFLAGFTMGGGVGVGCHGSHRIVCDSSRIAMPEVTIGLLPDVGGSLLLSQAPGRLGEYLGITGARFTAGDAILAGFADYFIPAGDWDPLKDDLCKSGDWTRVDAFAQTPPTSRMSERMDQINGHFGGEALADIVRSLRLDDSEFASETLEKLGRNSPLAMACGIEAIHRIRGRDDICLALELEYRFVHRAMAHADFLEGIRAALIDRDQTAQWMHSLDDPIAADVTKMMMPLGAEKLDLRGIE